MREERRRGRGKKEREREEEEEEVGRRKMKSSEMTGGMTLYFIKRQPHSSKPCTVATKQSYLSGKLHQ